MTCNCVLHTLKAVTVIRAAALVPEPSLYQLYSKGIADNEQPTWLATCGLARLESTHVLLCGMLCGMLYDMLCLLEQAIIPLRVYT
jgi:hypothetical protein